jgi:hypothetical protein
MVLIEMCALAAAMLWRSRRWWRTDAPLHPRAADSVGNVAVVVACIVLGHLANEQFFYARLELCAARREVAMLDAEVRAPCMYVWGLGFAWYFGSLGRPV